MTTALARRSAADLRELFRTAACPDLADVTGRLRAEIAGPAAVRIAAPIAFRLTGLSDWWGKDLRPADDGILAGHNLAGPDGERTTLALLAEIGPSRTGTGNAVLVNYPPTAPWPWRNVVDELRLLPDGTVIALTFGLPLMPGGGSPFLLRREG